MRKTMPLLTSLAGVALMALPATGAIQLQNATATFSQADFGISESIDGVFDGFSNNGWALDPDEIAQSAAFETALNTPSGLGTLLTFNLHQLFEAGGNGEHLIGYFRLSATTDDRSLFADGLQTGGDVVANWTVLTPSVATSLNGSTLTVQGDGSILASGDLPQTDVYTIQATTSLTGITGFLLEVFEDSSLPDGGPGRKFNGNFVLTEFTVDAQAVVPEPATICVWLGLGLAACGMVTLKRKLA